MHTDFKKSRFQEIPTSSGSGADALAPIREANGNPENEVQMTALASSCIGPRCQPCGAPRQRTGPRWTTPSSKSGFSLFFLKKRSGHARLVTCHAHGSPPLQPFSGSEQLERRAVACEFRHVEAVRGARQPAPKSTAATSPGVTGWRRPLSRGREALDVAERP